MLDVLTILALLGVLWYLVSRFVGFTAQRPEDYAGQQPQIDIRRHLSGPILCEGVIYGPTGRVTSRFVADMHGRWTGNRGVLEEQFRYASGQVQNRRWTLAMGNDGTVVADADDIVEPGHGRQEGAGLQLKYRIRLPEHAGGWVLDVTDWMYLMDNGTIINRSQFRKFGIKVAELVATLRPALT
ncbi:DUF3833 domain-containing protein [Pararhodobacter zhoushanensis]|uniref:DUF3833 domain-containing protein n=1 Tax=Pararhodobacter zhoushanensis TaxID=2479545 RepID=UPI000F8CC208|nr:DUF3833 domain-containing protein [Pararhodobacter zhoushanensis]